MIKKKLHDVLQFPHISGVTVMHEHIESLFREPRYLLAFFSSRRRHTISFGDWSSDVCSSDLFGIHIPLDRHHVALLGRRAHQGPEHGTVRSEERRVGKEGRSRWSPYH